MDRPRRQQVGHVFRAAYKLLVPGHVREAIGELAQVRNLEMLNREVAAESLRLLWDHFGVDAKRWLAPPPDEAGVLLVEALRGAFWRSDLTVEELEPVLRELVEKDEQVWVATRHAAATALCVWEVWAFREKKGLDATAAEQRELLAANPVTHDDVAKILEAQHVAHQGIERVLVLVGATAEGVGRILQGQGVTHEKLDRVLEGFDRLLEHFRVESRSLGHLGDRDFGGQPSHYSAEQPVDGFEQAGVRIPPPPATVRDFFYPLWLGTETLSVGNNGEDRAPLEFPFFVEDPRPWRKRFSEQHEAEVLQQWLRQPGVHALVGEPGAGKSTLLREWTARLYVLHQEDAGRPVGFYVPLRDVDPSDGSLKTFFARLGEAYGIKLDVTPFLSSDPPAPPVWLFDGLDELDPALRNRWLDIIAECARTTGGHPGAVCIVSCRTAPYQGEFGKPTYVMGLNPKSQREFLDGLLSAWRKRGNPPGVERADEAWRHEFHGALSRHPNLRRLAGSPLLLRLLAEVGLSSEEMRLPRNRVEFYPLAFEKLLDNRVELTPVSRLPGRLKEILVRLADRAQLAPSVPKGVLLEVLEQADASKEEIDALLTSGILQPKGPSWSAFEFLHLTFQEWFLAEALKNSEGLLEAVRKHWLDPRFEETLSLLWGLASAEERNQATEFLIEQDCHIIEVDGQRVGRGGLRTALHLWGRSGADLARSPALPRLLEELGRAKSRHTRGLRRLAVALDPACPAEILSELAQDEWVRREVAENAGAPAEVLVRLASDEAPVVRQEVAGNAGAPAEALVRLAGDEEEWVRREVAENAGAPAEVLVRLAGDEDAVDGVARNAGAPAEVLVHLAGHEDARVRDGVARNAGAPAEVLVHLAGDERAWVRRGVAGNAGAPAEVLVRLAGDEDPEVRRGVAGNAGAPAEVLVHLAGDEDARVRRGVAGNAGVPAEVLVRLAGDEDAGVRRGVAGNAGVPAEVLVRLAGDEDAGVRGGVARNAGAPAEVLVHLAGDEDAWVRRGVAGNAGAPAEALVRLAGDKDPEVRRGVAGNAGAPAEVLVHLAGDEDAGLRRGVARNAGAPAEVLVHLAGDEDARVRRGVAGKAGAPAKALVHLAGDKDPEVRRGVAGNAGAPAEALVHLAGDEDPEVRRLVAGNAGAPAEALVRLAGDEVSSRVARNANSCLEWF